MLIQATILGFIFGELWYFTQAVATALSKSILASGMEVIALAACVIALVIVLLYAYFRNIDSDIRRLWRSNHADLLALVVLATLGFTISAIVGGVGTLKYQKYVSKIDVHQLFLLCLVPLLIALLYILRAAIKLDKPPQPSPFFINDQAKNTKNEDLLGVSEYAARFAERVLNDSSSDSLVFGIDAPWGIGKSSFINFCHEYWKNVAAQPIVHRFEPLRYTNSADLVDRFVNELINTIQEHAFVPSIRSLFFKYLRLVKGKGEFSFLGIKVELERGSGSVDEMLETLSVHLSRLDRKIIIVVDDLDRLSWSEIKNILFAIKRSFMLPNVSYVLCYDTENLASLGNTYDDAEKVKEFLEKFVNVKTGVFIDSETLADFVSSNIEAVINRNLQLNVHMLDQIRQALGALVVIFKSDEFVHYQNLLGDIRKLKRLINTMMLFEIQDTDFSDSDYNKLDLIHLLLVYINYPNTFRKIYNSETGGRSGFFSLILSDSPDSKGQWVNSHRYTVYLQSLQSENQKFLLNMIFSPSSLYSSEADEEFGLFEEDLITKQRTRACFNGRGDTSRNLERYLNLIVKLSKQEKRDRYQFYVNKKNSLLEGKSIEQVLDDDALSFAGGDFARDQLWTIISNNAHQIKSDIGSNLVEYLIHHIPEYSFFEEEKISAGSRVKLIYSLLKLLDSSAWGGSLTGRRNNTEKNISEIAQWVFGEQNHANSGVINTLARPDRGVLGLYDLLLFRLYCSADRGNSLFNLQRAISLHGNPSAPTSGLTTEIAKQGMREISQIIFRNFRKQYIEPNRNFFEITDALQLEDLAGKSTEFVRSQIKSGAVTQDQITKLIAVNKSRVKSFVVYQLANSMIRSGVGCGYYDETGNNDQSGIAKRMNEYLFDQCFNAAIDQKNFGHFLDYLLISLEHTFEGDDDGFPYIPSIAGFTKVLDKERLKNYWSINREEILSLNFDSQATSVFTSNFEATYESRLPAVYRLLDELVGE